LNNELHSLLEIEDGTRDFIPEWVQNSLEQFANEGNDKEFDELVIRLRADGYGHCTIGFRQPLTVDEIAQRVSVEKWDSLGLMD